MRKRYYFIPAFLLTGVIGFSALWNSKTSENKTTVQKNQTIKYSQAIEITLQTIQPKNPQRNSLENKIQTEKTKIAQNPSQINSPNTNLLLNIQTPNEQFNLGYKPEQEETTANYELETAEILGQDCTGKCIYSRDTQGNIQKTEDTLSGRIDFTVGKENYTLNCNAQSYWILIDNEGGLQSFGTNEKYLNAKDACKFEEKKPTINSYTKDWQ